MSFFRYYQRSEKESWQLLEETTNINNEAEKLGVKRMSILAINTASPDIDQEKVAYKGPFYIDIDNPQSLDEAIASTKELVSRLRNIGLESSSFEVYASGSKGFHVIIHEKAFYNGRAKKYLPLIYKNMAIDLYVPGMDFQVYCVGKGNLFRRANVKREDGHYKVRVLPEELETLTAVEYKKLCSAPRKNLIVPETKAPARINTTLAQMFASAEARFKHDEKTRIKIPVADSLLAPFVLEPPHCVRDLAECKVHSSRNFNEIALQMGIYLARSGTKPPLLNSLISRMAHKSDSSSYPTTKDRDRHLHGLYKYLLDSPKKQFSCQAMRAILQTRPCDGCELENKTQAELEQYEIEERIGGYYAVSQQDKTTARRLTSFVLVPIRLVYEVTDRSDTEFLSVVEAKVESQGEYIGLTRIREESWASRSKFLDVVSGMGNLKVTVSDNDVQNLKHFVLRDIENVEDVEEVTAAGIHRQAPKGRIRYTYVEKGLSINRFQIRDTHILSATVNAESAAFPNFRHCSIPQQGCSNTEHILRSLFELTVKEKISAIIGWFAAAHLKAHLMGMHQQFPLLNLWGGAGSGKTRTASIMGFLSGCDYLKYPPPSLATTTLFPVYATLMSTTTIPRLFDEFNTTSGNRKLYETLTETFKAVYNGLPMQRGRIARSTEYTGKGVNAVADYYPMRAPVAILGEQHAARASLNERMISVEMKSEHIPTRTNYMDHVSGNTDVLTQIGKAMMLSALEIREDWVQQKMEGWKPLFPTGLKERVTYNLQVIGLGLDFLRHVLVKNLHLNLDYELDQLCAAFKDSRQTLQQIFTVNMLSEADKLVNLWADLIMWSLSQLNDTMPPTTYSTAVSGKILIDLATAFFASSRYSSNLGQEHPIGNATQALSLLKSEPYFEDFVQRKEMVTSRPVLVLNLQKLQEKGIETSRFFS